MTSRIRTRIGVAGLLMFAAGVAWGVYFVGVPYQDPTPAQEAREMLHVRISSWLMVAGLVALAASAVATLFGLLLGRAKSPPVK